MTDHCGCGAAGASLGSDRGGSEMRSMRDELLMIDDRLIIVKLNFGPKIKERARFILIVDVNVHERRVTLVFLVNKEDGIREK